MEENKMSTIDEFLKLNEDSHGYEIKILNFDNNEEHTFIILVALIIF